MKTHDFEKELVSLINKHSLENGSNTPDFILAEYLKDCLLTFNIYIKKREKWHGREEGEFNGIKPDPYDIKIKNSDGKFVKANKAKPFKKYKCELPPNDEETKKDMEEIEKFGKKMRDAQQEKLKNIKIIQSVDIETDKIFHMNPATFNKLKEAGIVR